MKKAVITAFDITTARRAGQTSINVPNGALVTPQAADDARDHGIALVRDGTQPAALPSRPGAPSTQTGSCIADEVRRQVLARLGNAAPAMLDAVITSVMTDSPDAPATDMASAIRKAGTVSLVASSALSVQNGTGPGPAAVTMVEALPPDAAHPGIASMRWENSSFAWTFKHAEVLVVLEGEITLTASGETLVGKPGDAFLIPAGSSVTLSAKGVVRCVHSSWPNPATAKG